MDERNIPEIFFKSHHDKFQYLTALHSLVTGALGGEVERADAVTRHQGRCKPLEKKIRVQQWGFIEIFSIPEVYRFFSQYRGLIGVDTNNPGVDLQ